MKVTISVGGRFHAFNLASELARHGNLRCLITSYPVFAAVKYGVPKELVSSLWSKEIIERVWQKLPEQLEEKSDPTIMTAEHFDKKAAYLIPGDTDIFVGWSSFSLNAIRYAKTKNILTVLDHGSAHIQYHVDILKEEYKKFGIQLDFDQRMIDKQLKEYAEADYIVLPSKFAVRTFIEKNIPEKKLICVPYGADISSFRQSPKGDDVFRVVYAGGMTLQKGVHYLLKAFAELALPNSELLLVGTMHDEIRPFMEKYPGARAIGAVPQSELHKYYSQSSLFVLDSVQDGFGMVIVQAMACGLPVIASENTGGPDIIREGKDGFIVPIRNIDALKEKIKYFYDHPRERDKMGVSAAERVKNGFTWQDYGCRIMAEYSRILQKG